MVEAKSKKELSLMWLEAYGLANYMVCPFCQAKLDLDKAGLLCPLGHRFDLSRQGYFFMAKQGLKESKYDQRLFDSRRYMVREIDLYRPLTQFLVYLVKIEQPQFLLDAGSGEGSHLMNLHQALKVDQPMMLGVDLSKAGIKLSTDYVEFLHCMIADLANLPLKNNQVDMIINLLSPSNYREFKRILSSEGILIKVIPSENYLQEIRQGLKHLGFLKHDHYDNRETRQVFAEHFPNYVQHSLEYHIPLKGEDLLRLVEMTPLTWKLSSFEKEELVAYIGKGVTIALDILMSRPDKTQSQ